MTKNLTDIDMSSYDWEQLRKVRISLQKIIEDYKNDDAMMYEIVLHCDFFPLIFGNDWNTSIQYSYNSAVIKMNLENIKLERFDIFGIVFFKEIFSNKLVLYGNAFDDAVYLGCKEVETLWLVLKKVLCYIDILEADEITNAGKKKIEKIDTLLKVSR